MSFGRRILNALLPGSLGAPDPFERRLKSVILIQDIVPRRGPSVFRNRARRPAV